MKLRIMIAVLFTFIALAATYGAIAMTLTAARAEAKRRWGASPIVESAVVIATPGCAEKVALLAAGTSYDAMFVDADTNHKFQVLGPFKGNIAFGSDTPPLILDGNPAIAPIDTTKLATGLHAVCFAPIGGPVGPAMLFLVDPINGSMGMLTVPRVAASPRVGPRPGIVHSPIPDQANN